MNQLTGIFILIICCMVGLVSCSKEQDTSKTKPLRIAVLPDQSPERLRARYTPLLDYLATQLEVQIELIIPDNYADMLERFHRNEIDLAHFGGLSFVKAAHKDAAIPIVMRDIDTRFSSYYLVRADNPAKSLVDLRGKKLGFGSRLSTSGHLMPRFFLRAEGINTKAFFASINFSGAHDKTDIMCGMA